MTGVQTCALPIYEVVAYRVVKDDAVQIRSALVAFTREATVVISSGGTGITGRDVTVPVVESLITKPIPGFGELFRMLSYEDIGPAAMLSRATAGTVGRRVLFVLPGSEAAVRLAMTKLILPELGHVISQVRR